MKRICAVVCAAALLAGCAAQKNEDKTKDNITLSWWVPLYQHVEKTSSNFSDNELYKELMKRTGTNIEFVHPKGIGDLDVLLMSKKLPDLIEYDFLSYKGGPQTAIDENVIISIDSLLKDCSPNYAKILKDNPKWDAEVVTEKGMHYTYAWLRGDESLLYWRGLQIRKDLLEQAGLSIPTTIEQWDTTIRTFQSMGIKYPLSFMWSFGTDDPFVSAFNTLNGYYQIDGVVKFSPLEIEYREYIQTLNRWFQDKLLDAEFLTQSEQLMESKIMAGQVGAYVGTLGGNMGNCISELKKKGAVLNAAPIPVKNAGDEIFQSLRDDFYQPATSVAISSSCKNIKAAAKLLDYGYGEEGHLLYNFGIEGISFRMVDKYPEFLPEITENPDGLSIQHAMSKYMASAYGGPFVQDKREYEQYLRYPEQKEAIKLWSSETQNHKLPKNIGVSAELENKNEQITQYCNDMIIKFITGEIPMSEYDGFTNKLIELGVYDVISCKQQKLERFSNINK